LGGGKSRRALETLPFFFNHLKFNRMFKALFKIGGEVPPKLSAALGIFGICFIGFVWLFITDITNWVKPATIPSPVDVLYSFKELFFRDSLVSNTIYSIKLNVWGYIEAIAISLPLGFIIYLVPLFRGMFSRPIDAMRYIPITGLVGIFIAWFGIGMGMKAHFLSFGVIVYLLPVVIQRVRETEQVYLDTVWTLGAKQWQLFFKVYLPSTLAKVFVDIRVITAISWTYIIVAEMVNNEGGVGAMVYQAAKQSRIDKIFAIIVFIVFIGFIQDKLFQILEKWFFKYKFLK
jgi:NitT/TauT family transport system permease protein